MFLNFLFSLIISFPILAQSKPITVAIIDTGFGATDSSKLSKHLCKLGHKDFTVEQLYTNELNSTDPVPLDLHGHGTNIAGLIEKNAGFANYCLIIIKAYSPRIGQDNLASTLKAIRYAKHIKADFINYSGGGNSKDEAEVRAVKEYLDNGGTLVAAAGNETSDLAKQGYYPALDDSRVVVVGNMCKRKNKNVRCESSNFGKRVNIWEYGENATAYELTMTGTSQATAITTGKLVLQKENNMINNTKELQIRK